MSLAFANRPTLHTRFLRAERVKYKERPHDVYDDTLVALNHVGECNHQASNADFILPKICNDIQQVVSETVKFVFKEVRLRDVRVSSK